MKNGFIPVDKLGVKCPICGHGDWCMANVNMVEVMCNRPEYKHISHNYQRKNVRKNTTGVVYTIDPDSGYAPAPIKVTDHVKSLCTKKKEEIDFSCLADQCYMRTNRESFSRTLGISVRSCSIMGVGYTEYYHREYSKDMPAYTIPVVNADKKIIGIKLRFVDGHKSYIKGSAAALLMPTCQELSNDILFVPEGESDVFAAIDIGLPYIAGKPGRLSGDRYLADYLKKCYRPLVIISDRDRDGMEGARRSAEILHGLYKWCKVILPPAKDLREWHLTGKANIDGIMKIINNTKEFVKGK